MFSCNISKNVNKTVIDEKSGKEILIEGVNRDAFKKDGFKEWFNEEYNSYKPAEGVVEHIKDIGGLDEIKIIIVFGSWCGDSRREVPRFYKVLDEINFSYSNVTVIAVDHSKQAKHKALQGLLIKRVPTIFFYKNDKYIGKIEETPIVGLEQDMLNILIGSEK